MYLFSYLLLLFFLIFFEIKRFKYTQVDAITFFHTFFVLNYLLPAILWSWFPEHSLWKTYDLQYNAAVQPFVLFILFFSYIVLVCTYYTSMTINFRYLLSVKINCSMKRFYKSQLLFSLLVVILILLAAYLEGGIVSYIQNGISSRYYSSNGGVSQYLKYFLYPVSIWFIALLAMYFERENKSNYLMLVFMSLFFMAMMLFTLSLGGRAAIIYVFLNVILFLLVYNQSIRTSHVFLFFISVALVMFIMSYYRELTFVFLNEGEVSIYEIDGTGNGVVESFLGVFSYYKHYFYTLNEFLYNSDLYEYPRLGLDSLRAFFTLVPGVDFRKDVDVFGLTSNVSEINKYVIGGYTGYIPPGWIGMALIDGGLIWLSVKLLFLGVSAAFINKSFINFDRKSSISMYFYFLLIFFGIIFYFFKSLLVLRNSP
ncbi:O-antigen polymerase [Pseudoalteromonas mariniglutinosa]